MQKVAPAAGRLCFETARPKGVLPVAALFNLTPKAAFFGLCYNLSRVYCCFGPAEEF